MKRKHSHFISTNSTETTVKYKEKLIHVTTEYGSGESSVNQNFWQNQDENLIEIYVT